MTKYILSESQMKTVINELFSQKLIQSLTDKFKQDNPNLDDNTLNFYINRFQQIKESPKVQNKDITTYSWENLKHIIDLNQPDVKIMTNGKEELLYNQNNLKIYRTNSQQACVNYGTGYNFCISSRGRHNFFDKYRFGSEFKNQPEYSTIYFIIDEDKTKEKNNYSKLFIDPSHLVVLIVIKKIDGQNNPISYSLTDANNKDTINYENFSEIESEIPKLKGLQSLFTFVEHNSKEIDYKKTKKEINDLKHKYKRKLDEHLLKLFNLAPDFNSMFISQRLGLLEMGIIFFAGVDDLKHDLELINNYIHNKPNYLYSLYYRNPNNHPDDDADFLIKLYPNKNSTQKWIDDDGIDGLSNIKDDIDIEDIDITPVLPTQKKYIKYIIEVKNTFMEYLHEKNKQNIK